MEEKVAFFDKQVLQQAVTDFAILRDFDLSLNLDMFFYRNK